MHVRTLSWYVPLLLMFVPYMDTHPSMESNAALPSRQVQARHRHTSPCNPPHKTAGIPCQLTRYSYLYQNATITYFAGINGSPLHCMYKKLDSCSPRSGQDSGGLLLLAVTLMAMHLDGVVTVGQQTLCRMSMGLAGGIGVSVGSGDEPWGCLRNI
jgi:hypothetical protein